MDQSPRAELSPTELAVLDDERWDALVDADIARLNALFHADLSYTHADGSVDSKSSYLAALSAGTFRYNAVQREEVQARLFGSTGVVTGRATVQAEFQGKAVTVFSRYSAVWAHDGAGWQVVCWHSCPTAEAG
jgi:hypothetical protein